MICARQRSRICIGLLDQSECMDAVQFCFVSALVQRTLTMATGAYMLLGSTESCFHQQG